MATAAVIGDGPAGLSAALFLAKNGVTTTVYGQDETAMHHALLRNYLGLDETAGTRFQEHARAQVQRQGARLVHARVEEVARDGDGFDVRTEDDDTATVDYVVLAGWKACAPLARGLGLETPRTGVEVDTDNRSAVDGVYVVGRLARPARSQAIISAGAGAVAALDILAREAGKDVTDWDTPDE